MFSVFIPGAMLNIVQDSALLESIGAQSEMVRTAHFLSNKSSSFSLGYICGI